MMDRSCSDLPWHVSLEVDGKNIEIPEVTCVIPSIRHNFIIKYIWSIFLIWYPHQDAEGVIVMNIPSYMGGVDLWQNDSDHDDDFSLQSIHDKMLEVVCISGTWHLGKLQVHIFYFLLNVSVIVSHFLDLVLFFLICRNEI